jgi:hypothetical protein
VALAALVTTLAACGGAAPAEEPVTTIAPPAETGAPAAATTSGPEAPFRAALEAPTSEPEVLVRWNYRVTVTDDAGEPLPATVTVEVVDPLQQAHPVDYDGTTEPIVDRPFEGEFSDYVEWPPESRGVSLTFRVTVEAEGAAVELTYPVTPR